MNVHLVRLIVLIVLVLLSAFFSSAETAFMTVNRVKIKALADEGNKRAASVIRICEDTQKMLSAILIGNNIVNLSASALMTIFVTDLWGSLAVGIGTGVLTLVVLVFGEILPKTIATAYSENISLWYAGVILFIMAITKPLSFIINGVASAILKLLRVDVQNRVAMTENELKTYVDVSHEDGVIETGEKEIIYNVFDFSDAVAKDIMIPRIDMSCVSSDDDYNEVMRVFKDEMYTRIPVYEGNEQDNIIGLRVEFYSNGSIFPDWVAQFGFGFYSLMLTSTLIGLIVMALYKERTWCSFCPMGTMTQGICKIKEKRG